MSFLTPIIKHPGEYRLRNARAGTVLATYVEVAADSASRRRGLLGRDRFEAGHALVIAPCGGVHMFFMKFAIDVLFVRKDGRVVKAVQNLRPWRLALAVTAYAAIELPAGTLQHADTRRGDSVILEIASTANL